MVIQPRAMGLAMAFCAWLFTLPCMEAFASDDRDIMVVVHDSVQLEEMSLPMLREIILGQRRFWPTGERVELVVEATPGPARDTFVERLSGMTEAQFQHYWTSLIFSYRATRPPRAAPDRRLALALVNAIPGALTLVEAGNLPENVRVLRVDGWLDEAGNRLQP